METTTTVDSNQGGNAPIGTEPAGSTPQPAQSEPTPYDVADDTLIRVKGVEKPVKFGDHVKGFQTQFTKASQEAARLKKELETERAQRAQFEQQQAIARQQAQQNQGDPLSQLKQLPYLTGAETAELFSSMAQQFQQRDQVLIATIKQLGVMKQALDALQSTHSSSAFDAKISKFLNDGGYPDDAGELARDIYLSYEGDDLDAEFPRIFAERYAQLERIFEARRQAALRESRKAPFIPGKGGAGSPSKPLQLDPRASAAQLADQMWNSLQDGSGT